MWLVLNYVLFSFFFFFFYFWFLVFDINPWFSKVIPKSEGTSFMILRDYESLNKMKVCMMRCDCLLQIAAAWLPVGHVP